MGNAGLHCHEPAHLQKIRHRNQIDDESWVVGAEVTNGLVCIVANSAKFTVLEDDRKLLRENSAALFKRSDL